MVCVETVPYATADRQFEQDFTVDRVEVDGLLPKLDQYVVEPNLQLNENSADEENDVIALTVGPEAAEAAVLKALQLGADSAARRRRRRDRRLYAIASSLVLAKAIERIGQPDLVITGLAVSDSMMNVMPAMLAERLGLPRVTQASVVETQGDQVRIKRDTDIATEVIGGTIPLVLSVTDQSGEARYPSFRGIMAASKPLETYSLADLGVDASQVGLSVAWSEVAETAARPPGTASDIVEDHEALGATALVEFLSSNLRRHGCGRYGADERPARRHEGVPHVAGHARRIVLRRNLAVPSEDPAIRVGAGHDLSNGQCRSVQLGDHNVFNGHARRYESRWFGTSRGGLEQHSDQDRRGEFLELDRAAARVEAPQHAAVLRCHLQVGVLASRIGAGHGR